MKPFSPHRYLAALSMGFAAGALLCAIHFRLSGGGEAVYPPRTVSHHPDRSPLPFDPVSASRSARATVVLADLRGRPGRPLPGPAGQALSRSEDDVGSYAWPRHASRSAAIAMAKENGGVVLPGEYGVVCDVVVSTGAVSSREWLEVRVGTPGAALPDPFTEEEADRFLLEHEVAHCGDPSVLLPPETDPMRALHRRMVQESWADAVWAAARIRRGGEGRALVQALADLRMVGMIASPPDEIGGDAMEALARGRIAYFTTPALDAVLQQADRLASIRDGDVGRVLGEIVRAVVPDAGALPALASHLSDTRMDTDDRGRSFMLLHPAMPVDLSDRFWIAAARLLYEPSLRSAPHRWRAPPRYEAWEDPRAATP